MQLNNINYFICICLIIILIYMFAIYNNLVGSIAYNNAKCKTNVKRRVEYNNTYEKKNIYEDIYSRDANKIYNTGIIFDTIGYPVKFFL